MPYYSVKFRNGSDPKVKKMAIEAKSFFGGRDVDYTGHGTEFYIERSIDLTKVEQNVQGWAGEEFEIIVKEITEEEYNWKSHQ